MTIRWTARFALVVALVAPMQASAEYACLPLRTFTPEERQQFESQHGVEWWKTIGPGTLGGCANTLDPSGPKER